MLFKIIVLYLKWRRPTSEKFEVWTRLGMITTGVTKSIEEDITKFPDLIYKYINLSLHISVGWLHKLEWTEVILLYHYAQTINTPNKIPLLVTSLKKEKPLSWDYPNRDWNYWSHLLAATYGWSLEYISKLDTNIALAHIQEILTDEQLDREFIWSTSEIAYPYNSTTKQSRFSPLERPYFMAMIATQPKKIRMLKSLIPVGNIENLGGM